MCILIALVRRIFVETDYRGLLSANINCVEFKIEHMEQV